MTKLLSDEELLKKVEEECDAVFRTAIALNSGKSIKEAASDIFDLINTQKRLYAESVIGEDERPASETSPLMKQLSPNTNRIGWRNDLRAEQRKRVNDD